jgi:hypothetical protein
MTVMSSWDISVDVASRLWTVGGWGLIVGRARRFYSS